MTTKEFEEGIKVGIQAEEDEIIAKMKGLTYEQWMAEKKIQEKK